MARQNITLALYENPGSLLAWNLHLLLLPEALQRRWFGEEYEILLPVLTELVSQTPEKSMAENNCDSDRPFYSAGVEKFTLPAGRRSGRDYHGTAGHDLKKTATVDARAVGLFS